VSEKWFFIFLKRESVWKNEVGIMGSLEDKVARLSPEQRREVENFIDFTLQKTAGFIQACPGNSVQEQRTADQVKPVILAEEKPLAGHTVIPDPLPVLEDLKTNENSGAKRDMQPRSVRPKGKDPGLLLDWIE
jgi:hypothetical protein